MEDELEGLPDRGDTAAGDIPDCTCANPHCSCGAYPDFREIIKERILITDREEINSESA